MEGRTSFECFSCKIGLDFSFVEGFLAGFPEVARQLDYHARNRALEGENWVKCPLHGCFGGDFACGEIDRLDCQICQHGYCSGCGLPWTLGTQHACQVGDDEETAEWKKRNSRPCPSCQRPIQKSIGCDHMVCSCGYEFCWLCGAKFEVNRSIGD